MITNIGKNLLAKYLIGQAPAYATHIAIGCGPEPKAIDDELTLGEFNEILDKKNLDFEMFRVPITSRGYVNELDAYGNPASKIVLTAELPTVERYEITEIGVYSAASNPTAGAYDSKTVYSFSTTENWERHTATTVTAVETINGPLATGINPGDERVISQASPIFQTNADNKTLLDIDRLNRYESCRYLNNTIFMAGNTSTLSIANGQSKMAANSGSEHIHLSGASINFDRNSENDELKLAFSIVNKSASAVANLVHPTRVKILLEFADTDSGDSTEYAQFQVDIVSGAGGYNFANNRYIVVTKKLKELVKSPSFTWNSVNVVKVWASVLGAGGTPTSDYYVALDAIRLENTSSINPLYGLTGYSVVKSPDLLPIVKVSNTANLVEFRFAIDVDLDTGNVS
jgi:hypothetical protein